MSNKDNIPPAGPPRLHLGWAVGLTVAVALPFSFFLGRFNFPIWVCFIVWAEYFALGATRRTFKLIVPSIAYGAFMGMSWSGSAIWLAGIIGGPYALYVALTLTGFLFMFLLCLLMEKVPVWSQGSLAVFNGLTLFLAVNATGSIPGIGPTDNPYFAVLSAFIWVCLLGLFGWVLGWLNVTLTFPAKTQ